MKPKEKAENLIEAMRNTYFTTSDWVYDSTAKQCALIAVEEILNNYYKNHYQTGKKIDYWQDVKKEIEKL